MFERIKRLFGFGKPVVVPAVARQEREELYVRPSRNAMFPATGRRAPRPELRSVAIVSTTPRLPLPRAPIRTRLDPPAIVAAPVRDSTKDLLLGGLIGYTLGQSHPSHSEPDLAPAYVGGGGDFGGGGASSSWGSTVQSPSSYDSSSSYSSSDSSSSSSSSSSDSGSSCSGGGGGDF